MTHSHRTGLGRFGKISEDESLSFAYDIGLSMSMAGSKKKQCDVPFCDHYNFLRSGAKAKCDLAY